MNHTINLRDLEVSRDGKSVLVIASGFSASWATGEGPLLDAQFAKAFLDDCRIVFFSQHRQQLMADRVAGVVKFRVGCVFAPGLLLFIEISAKFRAAKFEQRSDDSVFAVIVTCGIDSR